MEKKDFNYILAILLLMVVFGTVTGYFFYKQALDAGQNELDETQKQIVTLNNQYISSQEENQKNIKAKQTELDDLQGQLQGMGKKLAESQQESQALKTRIMRLMAMRPVIQDEGYSNQPIAALQKCPNKEPSDSPVAWWKLDEGKGDTALDASGRNNDGTLINNPAWNHENGARSLSFDGSSQYVKTNYSGILCAGARTVTAWIKTSVSAAGSGKADILSYGNSSNAYFHFLTADNYGNWASALGKTGLSFDQEGAAITYDAPGLYDNNWHFVAIVIPSSVTLDYIKFYEDGNALSTVNVSYNSGTTVNTKVGDSVAIGGTSAGTDLFTGSIADVRMFNRALPSSEILGLYNKGRQDGQ